MVLVRYSRTNLVLNINKMTIRRESRVIEFPHPVTVHTGCALILRGPNGSGKTSLLRVLAGLSEPETGSFYWHDREIKSYCADFLQSVTYIAHKSGMKSSLSVTENLLFYAGLKNIPSGDGDRMMRNALDQFGLLAHAHKLCGSLSEGQRRKLSLCRLPIEGGTLWLLDEPATALDKDARSTLATLIDGHLARGGIAVIATHQPLHLKHPSDTLHL